MYTYSQLTQVQRYQIYTLLKMGHLQSEIATSLGVHKSTISREIQRNQGKRGYRPKQAQQKALAWRKKGISRISHLDWSLMSDCSYWTGVPSRSAVPE